MGQYCFARWFLLSSVTLRVCGPAARRMGGRAADTARRASYGYVPLGRHFVMSVMQLFSL